MLRKQGVREKTINIMISNNMHFKNILVKFVNLYPELCDFIKSTLISN